MRHQRLAARRDLKRTRSQARHSGGERLEPDESLGGNRVRATLRHEGHFSGDIGRRKRQRSKGNTGHEMGWKSFHLNWVRKAGIVAHEVGRISRTALTESGQKFCIAIADEKRIIVSMLDRLRVGELEDSAAPRVCLRVYVLDEATGLIVL